MSKVKVTVYFDLEDYQDNKLYTYLDDASKNGRNKNKTIKSAISYLMDMVRYVPEIVEKEIEVQEDDIDISGMEDFMDI